MTPKTVAVLDDSPLVIDLTGQLLGESYRVVGASTAADFFTLLQQEKPDLALIDISMPVLEGDSVVGIATAQGFCECPILLYSSRSEAELKKLARSCGANGYVVKTHDAAALRSAVEKYLAK